VIKLINDLLQVCGFSSVSSTNKIDRHDITEILLKVAINTILTLTISNPNILNIVLKVYRLERFLVNT
jgi:hypothetical protein